MQSKFRLVALDENGIVVVKVQNCVGYVLL